MSIGRGETVGQLNESLDFVNLESVPFRGPSSFTAYGVSQRSCVLPQISPLNIQLWMVVIRFTSHLIIEDCRNIDKECASLERERKV